MFRRIIAGLEERKKVNERRNESRLNRVSEVVNVYKGGSMPREVTEGCTDFGKSGTSCLTTLDSPREEASTEASSESRFRVESVDRLYKKKGPRTEPCGTPVLIFTNFECKPSYGL